MDVVVALQQRQEQERSKSSASFAVNEAPSTDVVVRVACDAVQLGSVSSVTTTATCSDTLPTRPLIPFGPVWLSSSSKSYACILC